MPAPPSCALGHGADSSLPASAIHPRSVIERRWGDSEGSGYLLLCMGLNGFFWGAGGMALARGIRRSARLRRIIVGSTLLEITLLIALLVTGIPSPAAGPNLPASAATYAHLPAFALLAQVGLCCGSASRFIVSDYWGEMVQHPSPLALALSAGFKRGDVRPARVRGHGALAGDHAVARPGAGGGTCRAGVAGVQVVDRRARIARTRTRPDSGPRHHGGAGAFFLD